LTLLADTQGTPERVLSLLQLLAAHGGRLKRAETVAWLNPPFLRSGVARAAANSGADQTIRAASGLGLVASEDGCDALTPEAEGLTDRRRLADFVHRRLIAGAIDEPDAVLARVFAFVIVSSERAGGTAWLHEIANKPFADAVNLVLPKRENWGEQGRPFNEFRLAPFWRWMTFVGLAIDLAGNPHPYVADRLAIELKAAELPVGTELPIERLLEVVRARMPYLDGGSLYGELATAMSLPPRPRGVSPILSTALRDLQEEGALTLATRSDAAGVLNLSRDIYSPVSSAQLVTLNPEPVDG
jgi:hypothetical protein